MAKKTKNVINPRQMKLTVAAAKYTGQEPLWENVDLTDNKRSEQLMGAINWYNYHYNHKDINDFILDYLKVKDRVSDLKALKKVPDRSIPNAIAWLTRMDLMQWPTNKEEQKLIDDAIKTAISKVPAKIATVDSGLAKRNVQDIMRERALEAGGELEGMFDEFIADNCNPKHTLKPISVLKLANILPQHIGLLMPHWHNVKAELEEAYKGEDADLKEGYSNFKKIQLRNLIKFSQLVISDLNSYVAFKKTTRKPAKRKVKTPEQIVFKLKFQREDKALNIKSQKPTKIVGSKEMFVYNTKKRKLMHFLADEHAGNELVVKNNTIIGFDAVKSTQKTIRKPKEQLKEFMSASKPGSRKLYDNTNAVEIKISGRFSEEMLLLKVW